ncbi:unnamed protein product, partial [Mesorhabditis belari]|uniref:Uncharacterized protein n=1 Tax=Mesorhabditis belari TaxID=2138241 RepID=A0AAF3F778_9BILA
MFFSAPLTSSTFPETSSASTVMSRTIPDGVTFDSITSVSSHESQMVILGLLFIVIALLCVFVFCFDMIVCQRCRQMKKQSDAQKSSSDSSLSHEPKIEAVFHTNPMFIV